MSFRNLLRRAPSASPSNVRSSQWLADGPCRSTLCIGAAVGWRADGGAKMTHRRIKGWFGVCLWVKSENINDERGDRKRRRKRGGRKREVRGRRERERERETWLLWGWHLNRSTSLHRGKIGSMKIKSHTHTHTHTHTHAHTHAHRTKTYKHTQETYIITGTGGSELKRFNQELAKL